MTVQLALTGHDKDLGGGFRVRRLLPSAKRQSIGPFLFFDHFGPVTEQPGSNHDVRPHPHIGLATVTYLFEGAMMHRDSVGSVQRIEPGAINWMTAGRGIVHSERRPDDLRQTAYVNHGLQLWAALPRAHEEAEPSFTHTPAAAIPELAVGDAQVRVLIGQAFGRASPVATFAPTLYLDVKLAAGGTLELPPLAQEMALYPVDGELRVDGAGRHAAGGDRRRPARRPPLHVVELRLQPQGAHRAGLSGLVCPDHGPGAGRDGVHSTARTRLQRRLNPRCVKPRRCSGRPPVPGARRTRSSARGSARRRLPRST